MLRNFFSKREPQKSSICEKNEKNIHVKNAEKVLTTGFGMKVCSLILKHIQEGILTNSKIIYPLNRMHILKTIKSVIGKPMVEYVEMLSMIVAKNYGSPLTGYPGTSENKTPEQMLEGILSTLSAKYYDPRPFIHIKVKINVNFFLSLFLLINESMNAINNIVF